MSDRVFINNLEVQTIIGVYDWERTTPRPLLLNLEFELDLREAAASDDVSNTVDYAVVAEQVKQFASESSDELLETFGERLLAQLLERWPAKAVSLTIHKPEAVPGADVGISLRRTRPADVFISTGSNINAEDNTRLGVKMLRERFGDLQISSVYHTSAVGFEGDNFLNTVVRFNSNESPGNIAAALRHIEKQCGRKRGAAKFSARTLDLDLLLYDREVLDADGMDVPRREIEKYPFVLAPLAELVPQHRYPRPGKNFGQHYADMWAQFDGDKAGLKTLPFNW